MGQVEAIFSYHGFGSIGFGWVGLDLAPAPAVAGTDRLRIIESGLDKNKNSTL